MSGEQYSIFIKVDATQVNRATEELGRLGVISDSTEFSIKKLGKAAQEQDVWIKKLSASGREHVLWITKLSAASNEAAVASKTLSGAINSAEASTRKATGAFDALEKTAKSVRSMFVLFVGVEIARFLRDTAGATQEAADAYVNMRSKLDIATNSQQEMTKAFKDSFEIANKYYSSVTDVASAYAKFNPIVVGLGRSSNDTAKIVSSLSASLLISGNNTVDAAETFRQFAQAISGPNIQMEEMNTIIDSNQALWRGLQRQFPDIIAKYGSLKEAISKQAISSEMLINATIALGGEFEALAARKAPTVANAMTVLQNSFTQYIGEADDATGASSALATAILDLAQAIAGVEGKGQSMAQAVGLMSNAWVLFTTDVTNAKIALQELIGLQQAGTSDPEIQRLMQLGQGQVPIDQLAIKPAKPTTAPQLTPKSTGVNSKAAAKEAKDALEAFKAQIAAQVSAAENAEKIFSAQADSRKKRYEIEADQIKGIAELQIRATKSEAMRISIAEEAQTKIIDAINQETNLRQESLAKETEVTQAKLAGVQQELDMADAHKLKLADRLELTTKQSELETELAVKRQEQVQIELDAIGQIQSAERDLAEARQQAEETMVKEEALRQLEIMSSNLEYAKEMATGLAEAFGEVGAAIGGMSVAMAEYDKQSATIEIARKEAVDKAEGDQKRITEINDDATKKQAKAQIKAYGDMTQAAQGFFKKGSKGYEAMGAAVKVFRAFEMAQSAMSMANQLSDITKTIAAFVMGETAKTAASTQSVGQIVFNEQTKQLEFFKSSVAAQGEIPIAGFALMAAMAALMASFGISGGGGGGSTVVPSVPGTGTVKGDPSKQSESISRSLEILTENSSNDLNYSADMLASLRNIESALGAASDIIASKVLPTIANVVNKFTSNSLLSSSSVKEAGFLVNAQSLEKVLNSGALQGYLGARVEKETGLFGEFKSGQTLIAKYGKNVAEAFGKVVQEIYKSIENVSKSLGLTSEDIAKRADGLKISLGKINLAGMTAEEASKAIEAAFSAMSDTMARKLLPEFEAFWRNGEGYFETINRVAEGINRATGNLELLGMEAINYTEITDKQKDVAAEITRQTIMAQGDLSEGTRKYVKELEGSSEEIIDSYKQILSITNLMRGAGFGAENINRTMINAAGGLSAFEESLQSFRDNFMTDAQRLSADTELLTKEFGKLGFALPKSKDEFYALALGIDKSTEDGKKLFARVITLSQAFSDLSDKTKDATDATAELMESLESGVKNAAQDLLKAFQSELAALETAKQQWIQAYKALNSALQNEIKSMIDNYKAIRAELMSVKQAVIGSYTALKTVMEQQVDASLSAYKAIRGDLLTARDQLRSAYNEEQAAIQIVIDRTKNLSSTLRGFIGGLAVTSSNASPEQQYQFAKGSYEQILAQAMAGDTTAQSELQNAASAFLEASKQYYASSESYLQDYQQVVNTLTKVADQADVQTSTAELQLAELKKQVEQYITLNESTLNVRDAVERVKEAQDAETQAAKILNDSLVANGLLTAEQLANLRTTNELGTSTLESRLIEIRQSSDLAVVAQNALEASAKIIYETLVKNGLMTEAEFKALTGTTVSNTDLVVQSVSELENATNKIVEAQLAETEAAKIIHDTLIANGLMTEEQLSSLRESGDMNASSTQQKLDEMKAASEAVVAAQNALSKFSEQIHAVLVENGWMTQQEFNDLINGGNGTGAIKDGINNLGLATERVIEAQQTVAKSIDLLANEFGGLKETQKATAEAIVGALNNVGTQISASVGQAFDAYKMAIAELTKQQTAAAPAPAPAPAPTPEPVSAPVTAPTPVDNTSQRLQAAQSYSDRLNAELKIVNANTNNAIAAYNAGYQNAAVDFYEKAQQHQKAITAIKKEIESSGLNLKWARSGAGFSVTPYANGGMANPGLALVGENGPELVSFGSRGHVSTTSQTQGFFTNLQNAIEKGDAEQTNELQALVRLQSAANQQLIKEMKELKGEMAELARKAKLEAAA